MAKPTTHDDLFNIFMTRVREHGRGFLLAGELDEAARVLVDGEPAMGLVKFRLQLPVGEIATFTDLQTGATYKGSIAGGYSELDMLAYALPRFGCDVLFYSVLGQPPPREAIEAAFIELLDGARPSRKL
jgi:hypothetical protein